MHSIKTVSSNQKSAKTLKFEANVLRIQSPSDTEKDSSNNAESPQQTISYKKLKQFQLGTPQQKLEFLTPDSESPLKKYSRDIKCGRHLQTQAKHPSYNNLLYKNEEELEFTQQKNKSIESESVRL